MKTKKYVIALAVCFGTLFAAQATNLIELDGEKTEIRKRDITRVPGRG